MVIPVEVVVDQYSHRVGLAARMAILEEHRARILEHGFTHHSGTVDYGLPEFGAPAREHAPPPRGSWSIS
jgi:hypothetical protein